MADRQIYFNIPSIRYLLKRYLLLLYIPILHSPFIVPTHPHTIFLSCLTILESQIDPS